MGSESYKEILKTVYTAEEGGSFKKYSAFKNIVEANDEIEDFLGRIKKELPDDHEEMLN